MAYRIPEPLWLREMFETGKLSRNYNPKEKIISIKNNSSKDGIPVAILFDGPLIPPTSGAENRVYNIAKFLVKYGCKVTFLKCRRETDKINLLNDVSKKIGVNFELIHPEVFYSQHEIFHKLCKENDIDILYTKDKEFFINLAQKLKRRLDLKLVHDDHDVAHIFLNLNSTSVSHWWIN